MPELRHDPVVGYWTIISTERSRRPVEFRPRAAAAEPDCPFCEGRENQTPPEIYALRRAEGQPNKPGWEVRVVPSKEPILASGDGNERFGRGLYDLMDGAGSHEVVIESPHHKQDLDEMSVPEIADVVRVYISRLNELEKDPRWKYVLLFKNHGVISGEAGQVIRHSRSQLIAMPITPKRVKEELVAARSYFERRDRCVYCDVLRQELSDRSRIVCENAEFVAICPYASRSPFETWILPKRHSADFGRMESGSVGDFASILRDCLKRIRTVLNDPPYNSILHTAPYRHKKKEVYWKTIEEDYHWYFQISPRLTQAAGFEWGTGIHINPTPPEDAALILREAPASED